MLQYIEGGGDWDFWSCGFGYFLDQYFGFCAIKLQFFGFGAKKNFGFRFWCSLRFADFPFFNIWFSVFAKNTKGLSDLISDTVFGFSYLTYLGSGFSSIWAAIMRLYWSWIAANQQTNWNIARIIEFYISTWSFLDSITEFENEMFSEIRPN